uniref:Uncharacterized protein n=1 Tax=Meloidogyne incognita TaxID=6306 RepID=A0A914MVC9_MELIC
MCLLIERVIRHWLIDSGPLPTPLFDRFVHSNPPLPTGYLTTDPSPPLSLINQTLL